MGRLVREARGALKIARNFAAVVNSTSLPDLSGSNSVVESQLPKLLVAGSIPVSRSNFRPGYRTLVLAYNRKLLPRFSLPNNSSMASPAMTTSSKDVSAQG